MIRRPRSGHLSRLWRHHFSARKGTGILKLWSRTRPFQRYVTQRYKIDGSWNMHQNGPKFRWKTQSKISFSTLCLSMVSIVLASFLLSLFCFLFFTFSFLLSLFCFLFFAFSFLLSPVEGEKLQQNTKFGMTFYRPKCDLWICTCKKVVRHNFCKKQEHIVYSKGRLSDLGLFSLNYGLSQ